jgi:adenine-specific DNA methylase
MANGPRVTENEVAHAALQIAAGQNNGIATFPKMKKEIRNILNLSAGDRRQSITRPREQVWEQLIRNIKSHSKSDGNYIKDGYLEHVPRSGYRITVKGKKLLNNGP